MAVTHKWRGDEALAQMRKNVEKAVAQSAVTVQEEIKLQLNKSGPGPPSPPGSPPAKQTGNLGRVIQIDLSGITRRNPRARIGPDMKAAPYARIHEFGGPHHPLRPYMKPAKLLARPKILRFFAAKNIVAEVR